MPFISTMCETKAFLSNHFVTEIHLSLGLIEPDACAQPQKFEKNFVKKGELSNFSHETQTLILPVRQTPLFKQ